VSRQLSAQRFIPIVADSVAGALPYLHPPMPAAVIYQEDVDRRAQLLERCAKIHSIPANAANAAQIIPALRAALEGRPVPPPPAPAPPPAPPKQEPPPPPEPQPEKDSLASELKGHLDELEHEDYFAVLQVPIEAETADIRHAYLTLAKQWHPCRFGLDSQAVRRVVGDIFIVVKRAHDALIDPARRANYAELARSTQMAVSTRPKVKKRSRAR
jgi:hypothetical protein